VVDRALEVLRRAEDAVGAAFGVLTCMSVICATTMRPSA
jgi:hypothetical protein